MQVKGSKSSRMHWLEMIADDQAMMENDLGIQEENL